MHGRAHYHLALHVEGDIGLDAVLGALFDPQMRVAVRQGVFGDVLLDLPPCLDERELADVPGDVQVAVRDKAHDYLRLTSDWFDFARDVEVIARTVTLLREAWLGHPQGSLVLRVRTGLGDVYHVRNDVIVIPHTGHVFHMMPPRDPPARRGAGAGQDTPRSRSALAADLAQRARRQLLAVPPAGRGRRRRRVARRLETIVSSDPVPTGLSTPDEAPASIESSVTLWALDVSARVRERSQRVWESASDGRDSAREHRAALISLLTHACDVLQHRLYEERAGLSERLACIGPVQRLSYVAAETRGSRLEERTIGYGFRDLHACPTGWARQRLSKATRSRDGTRAEAVAERAHYAAHVRLQHLAGFYGGDDVPVPTAMHDLTQLLKAWQQLLDALLYDVGTIAQARRTGTYLAFPIDRGGVPMRPRVERGALLTAWRAFIAPNSADVAAGVTHDLSPVVRGIGGGASGSVRFPIIAAAHARHLLRLRLIGYEDLQFLRVTCLSGGEMCTTRVVAVPATRHVAAVAGRRRPWLSDVVCLCFEPFAQLDELVIAGIEGLAAADIVSVEWIRLPDDGD